MTQNPKNPARRKLFRTAAIASGLAVAARVTPLQPLLASVRQPSLASHGAADVPSFELDEITIAELQAGMTAGKYNARAIAEKYLARIDQIDKNGPAINAVIEINPDALAIAEALDKERADKGARGPLHGIPVLIKDNIDTADNMMTTAGSLALVGSSRPKIPPSRRNFAQAGAVILGKTNLSEWANIRSGHSTSGWSGRGGQTKNPYALIAILVDRARVRARDFRESMRWRDRHGDGRFDRLSVVQQWIGGIKPTVGLIEPHRHHSDFA